MRISSRIPEAIKTYTEYVLIIAFPRKHWLHEGRSTLHYMHIASLLNYSPRSGDKEECRQTRHLKRQTRYNLSAGLTA